MQGALLTISAAGALIAAGATFADRRRTVRADLDRIGLLPLPTIVFLGVLVAVLGLAFGIRG